MDFSKKTADNEKPDHQKNTIWRRFSRLLLSMLGETPDRVNAVASNEGLEYELVDNYLSSIRRQLYHYINFPISWDTIISASFSRGVKSEVEQSHSDIPGFDYYRLSGTVSRYFEKNLPLYLSQRGSSLAVSSGYPEIKQIDSKLDMEDSLYPNKGGANTSVSLVHQDAVDGKEMINALSSLKSVVSETYSSEQFNRLLLARKRLMKDLIASESGLTNRSTILTIARKKKGYIPAEEHPDTREKMCTVQDQKDYVSSCYKQLSLPDILLNFALFSLEKNQEKGISSLFLPQTDSFTMTDSNRKVFKKQLINNEIQSGIPYPLFDKQAINAMDIINSSLVAVQSQERKVGQSKMGLDGAWEQDQSENSDIMARDRELFVAVQQDDTSSLFPPRTNPISLQEWPLMAALAASLYQANVGGNKVSKEVHAKSINSNIPTESYSSHTITDKDVFSRWNPYEYYTPLSIMEDALQSAHSLG